VTDIEKLKAIVSKWYLYANSHPKYNR